MDHPDDKPNRKFAMRAQDIIVDTVIVDPDPGPTGTRLVQVNGRTFGGEDIWVLLRVRPDVRFKQGTKYDTDES